MKIRLLLMIGAFVIGSAASAETSFASSKDKTPPTKAPMECFTKITSCIFYPKVENPHIYDGLESTAEFSDSRPMTRYLDRPSHYLNDWLADPRDLLVNAKRVKIYHLWSPGVAWIERKDIVTFSELKKVEACWPVKQMVIENGDAPEGFIKFKPDGSGVATNESMGTKAHKVHAWYADGVYSVRITEPKTKHPYRESYEEAWGNIDCKNGLAIHRANWIYSPPDKKFEAFNEKDSSCQFGPVVRQ